MLNIKDLSHPELPTQANYGEALKLGLERFDRLDPWRVAMRAGGSFEHRRITVPHLERHVVLDVDAKRFFVLETGEEAAVWLAILTIHYLNNADGRFPTGNLKHFREFKEGQFYEPAFNVKTKDVLVQVFGSNPAGMKRAAEKLRGRLLETGDAAVQLPYFPCLPVTCILWQADEEFPAEASVLFDDTADSFFSAEDMAVAGQMAVLELVKASRG
ncbi:MAG: DUF3786 domain-containing protein [Thermodesulfobacteriota bacterium]